MEKPNQEKVSSRRSFLSLFGSRKPSQEKVKMLTPDGKLVEVDKAMLEKVRQGKKASNSDILQWMENTSQ